MKHDENTKRILEEIQQKITELDTYLDIEQHIDELNNEELLRNYKETLSQAYDAVVMAHHLTPAWIIFKSFSPKQKEDLIHDLNDFKNILNVISNQLDPLIDMYVSSSSF